MVVPSQLCSPPPCNRPQSPDPAPIPPARTQLRKPLPQRVSNLSTRHSRKVPLLHSGVDSHHAACVGDPSPKPLKTGECLLGKIAPVAFPSTSIWHMTGVRETEKGERGDENCQASLRLQRVSLGWVLSHFLFTFLRSGSLGLWQLHLSIQKCSVATRKTLKAEGQAVRDEPQLDPAAVLEAID